jgi:hypothetical protein
VSAAKPMTTHRRLEIYHEQTGRAELTARQRRRADCKAHVVVRELPRTGRLRRRYDRKDTAQIRREATQFVAFIRSKIAAIR